jgi:hypothetical protein
MTTEEIKGMLESINTLFAEAAKPSDHPEGEFDGTVTGTKLRVTSTGNLAVLVTFKTCIGYCRYSQQLATQENMGYFKENMEKLGYPIETATEIPERLKAIIDAECHIKVTKNDNYTNVTII